jgi:hypothetical protein
MALEATPPLGLPVMRDLSMTELEQVVGSIRFDPDTGSEHWR